MEIADLRKRLRQTLEDTRRANLARRERIDAASRAYETFLNETAAPVFRMFGSALRAEGYAFTVFTPANGLRLSSDRSTEDFIELLLDAETDPPTVAGRVNRGRGRRIVSYERPLRGTTAVEQLNEDDVLEFLLEEIAAFIER